ncbi:hypothetical protein LCGC14_1116080 [marine sediment metagenome]|uniref:Uncharacterized protein n=1 Tax=marine sediment metagenome TaxID=412755 RepID=A0A0F9M587_9ZZZZ
MKAEIIKSIKVKFILNEKEAVWLKGVMQNPFNVDDPMDEKEDDRINRIKIFDLLKDID